jgi:thymidylate synthase
MKVIECRNVHEALPRALEYLVKSGVRRESRNGPVLVSPVPVATVYSHPTERVMFWEERDANPAFHLYESLWMLEGRRDVAGPARYVKRMKEYSDDGRILHDAYGYRWRRQWKDQLSIIIERLRDNPEDRRCVLQMWHTMDDLNNPGKAVPCNLTATFQRDSDGRLDLVVFNRSNDILWGAYGANAVQFGTLLEYVAIRIGCPVGTYTQISVNWHAYVNSMEGVLDLIGRKANSYADGDVRVCPMGDSRDDLDKSIERLLTEADTHFAREHTCERNPFFENAYRVLQAHDLYTNLATPERYTQALDVLLKADQSVDWVIAMQQWILRRYSWWTEKMRTPFGITHTTMAGG